jgi:hypothetical protein
VTELEAFLEEVGLRPKKEEINATRVPVKARPKAETSDWYKQGKECPF